jgi:cyclohexanecarboxylate-CoA ligase
MAIESNVTKEQEKEYTRLGFWDKWTYCDYIKRWAKAFPDKEALIDLNTRITWSQYRTMMDRMALNFLEAGIKSDDLVVTQLPNCVEAVIAEFALARIGACMVALAVQWREHELDYIIKQTESRASIVIQEYHGFNYVDMMRELQTNHKHLKHIIVLGEDVPGGTVSFRGMWENKLEEKYSEDYLDKNYPIDANDVLMMAYTSGTEADPKGCPKTHNQYKCFVRTGYLGNMQENMNDRVVIALPWSNQFAQYIGILPMAMAGGTVILLDGFEPAVMAQAITKEKGTVYAGVPAMHVMLLNYPGMDKSDFSSLRLAFTGGAPTPTVVIKQMMEKFGCLVGNGFGSTEGHLNVTEIGMEPELVSSTIGVPQLYSEIKIIDEEGNRLDVNQTGEFCQKAPWIISGYYKRPDLNREKWDEEGFFHSGDACYLDESGFLHFVTRLKDIIIRGGVNISAEELEFILYKHPKILNVAVVGMPDPRLGEKCCAWVELKPGGKSLTVEEVRAFMEKEKVAKNKWPERIEVIDQLPRTPTGKVRKNFLRNAIAKKLEVEK